MTVPSRSIPQQWPWLQQEGRPQTYERIVKNLFLAGSYVRSRQSSKRVLPSKEQMLPKTSQ